MAPTVKMSTGSNNQDQIEDRSRFRSNDIELLNTGKFSDARVIVGGRAWNVHKSIVCMRSGFLSERLSGRPNAAGVNAFHIWNYNERQVEMLLAFIYSGRKQAAGTFTAVWVMLNITCHSGIETIDDLNFADCVQLSMLGEQFAVDGMEIYGKKALWRKLAPYLEPSFAVPSGFLQNTSSPLKIVTIDIRKSSFDLDFKGAVQEAYGGSGKTCQLLLADFIWMARGWLLHDPIIEDLNTTYPLLGSHVLNTLTKGPQSSFVQADAQLMSTANNSAGALSTNRPRARIMEGELFSPRQI